MTSEGANGKAQEAGHRSARRPRGRTRFIAIREGLGSWNRGARGGLKEVPKLGGLGMDPSHLSKVPFARFPNFLSGLMATFLGFVPKSQGAPTRGEGCVHSGESVPTHSVSPVVVPAAFPSWSVPGERPATASIPALCPQRDRSPPQNLGLGVVGGSSGLHAQGPVQPHHLPVDHGVLSQGLHQVGVLRGVPQP